jgi:guanylate kinase
MKQGLLIILSGPSGVGKGALKRKLMRDRAMDFVYSVSATTRMRRIKEVNGKDYYYLTKEAFDKKAKNGEFLEHTIYCDNEYGTPKEYVQENLSMGNNVLLEIEVTGAKQVMAQYHGMYVMTVFLLPPDMPELERRIRLRHTESDAQIQIRLKRAQEEMTFKDDYDVCLTNYTINKTAIRFQQAVKNRLNYIALAEAGQPTPPNYIIKRP